MSHVIVGRPTFLPHILWESRICRGGRPVIRNTIDALGPAVVRGERNAFGKATRERRQQGVIACGSIRRRKEDAGSKEIAWVIREDKPFVHKAHELSTRTSLIAHRRRQLSRQAVLSLKRVGVNIGRRNFGRRAPNFYLLAIAGVGRNSGRVEGQRNRRVRRITERSIVRSESIQN